MSPMTPRDRSPAVGQRADHLGSANRSQRTEATSDSRIRPPRFTQRQFLVLAAVAIAVAAVAAGHLSRDWWLPRASQFFAVGQGRLHDSDGHRTVADDEHGEVDAHADHDHSSGAETSLALSEQAKKNIGLRLMTVGLRDFDRTISVPAMVKERPGRTEIKVSAPMTGIVTQVYPIRGEAVTPGAPLFDLRLTHEDLVVTQSEFLETLERLDVIKLEVARLDKVTSSGAIAGRRLLERQYEQQQTEARLRAQQQALILHGITENQVNEIKTTRKLLQQVTIWAPHPTGASHEKANEPLLQVSNIEVSPGEQVEAGDPLGVLSDHATLYLEGKGFEEDSEQLNDAANQGTPITAVVEADGKASHTVPDLKILYLENQVEVESRALRFYVRLPNQLVRNTKTKDGHRFIGWRFKPGQRVQLLIPVEQWKNRIVLPVDAIVQDGAHWFVFQQDGNRFDRKPVHVEYRDPRWAVIASDGTLLPGDIVAASGAYQMHLTMKNQAGGGVDPHAGHHH
ncbi:MAG: efflux RND transporter periplasmic adaptor subunit [Pirellulales bacterium]|nr:efflux RND transporter periplasmic adaptor subunit [Pirellulales bacterium]